MAQCLSFFTFCSTLAIGCYVYTDIKRTTPVSSGWVSDGTNVYTVNSSGMIIAIDLCNNCTPSGTFITSYCDGCTLYYTYADGNCGTYDQIEGFDRSECGGFCGQGGIA